MKPDHVLIVTMDGEITGNLYRFGDVWDFLDPESVCEGHLPYMTKDEALLAWIEEWEACRS